MDENLIRLRLLEIEGFGEVFFPSLEEAIEQFYIPTDIFQIVASLELRSGRVQACHGLRRDCRQTRASHHVWIWCCRIYLF